jgi:(5-formylfuran-3-yl)methyl phosphate synthase
VRLLISVTDAAEAADAASAGADIIDVKDPSAGSLGQAPAEWVRAIRDVTPTHLPVSAALGDGPFEATAVAGAAWRLSESGARYVKVGLRDTTTSRALTMLRAVRAALPSHTGLIAVAFADAHRACCPHPAELPELAVAAGADGCLVDTAVKDGSGLLDWLDEAALSTLVAESRARRLLCGLAGSLRLTDLPRIFAVQPDIVGIRGAACTGDRVAGRISRGRVAALARSLHRPSVADPAREHVRASKGSTAPAQSPLPQPPRK